MTESSEEQKLKEARMISYEERSQLFLQKSTINTAKRGTKRHFLFWSKCWKIEISYKRMSQGLQAEFHVSMKQELEENSHGKWALEILCNEM